MGLETRGHLPIVDECNAWPWWRHHPGSAWILHGDCDPLCLIFLGLLSEYLISKKNFQGPRGDDGYIYITKIQQSGGILKMPIVLGGSTIIGNSDGRKMVPTSIRSSGSFCSASVIRNCLSILKPLRPFTSSWR